MGDTLKVDNLEELHDELQIRKLSNITKVIVNNAHWCEGECSEEKFDDSKIPDEFCEQIEELTIVCYCHIPYEFIERCISLELLEIKTDSFNLDRLSLNNCDILTISIRNALHISGKVIFPSVERLTISGMYSKNFEQDYIDKLISAFPDIYELVIRTFSINRYNQISFSKAKKLRCLELDATDIRGLDIKDNKIEKLTLYVYDVCEGVSESKTVIVFKYSKNLEHLKSNFPSLLILHPTERPYKKK